jgi:hypothetical protein
MTVVALYCTHIYESLFYGMNFSWIYSSVTKLQLLFQIRRSHNKHGLNCMIFNLVWCGKIIGLSFTFKVG